MFATAVISGLKSMVLDTVVQMTVTVEASRHGQRMELLTATAIIDHFSVNFNYCGKNAFFSAVEKEFGYDSYNSQIAM